MIYVSTIPFSLDDTYLCPYTESWPASPKPASLTSVGLLYRERRCDVCKAPSQSWHRTVIP